MIIVVAVLAAAVLAGLWSHAMAIEGSQKLDAWINESKRAALAQAQMPKVQAPPVEVVHNNDAFRQACDSIYHQDQRYLLWGKIEVPDAVKEQVELPSVQRTYDGLDLPDFMSSVVIRQEYRQDPDVLEWCFSTLNRADACPHTDLIGDTTARIIQDLFFGRR